MNQTRSTSPIRPTTLGLHLEVIDRIAVMAADRRTSPSALVSRALDTLAASGER